MLMFMHCKSTAAAVIIISVSALSLMAGCSRRGNEAEPAPAIVSDVQSAESVLSDDWTLFENAWTCLKTAGCAFKDASRQPAQFNMTYQDGQVFCQGKPVPADITMKDFVCIPRGGLVCNKHVESCACGGGKTVEGGNSCDGTSTSIISYRNQKLAVLPDKCDSTNVPKMTDCRNNTFYCGGVPMPNSPTSMTAKMHRLFLRKPLPASEDWKCIDSQWLCTAESCPCGILNTGKYGACQNGIPMCGSHEMPAREETGYICQNGSWVCANPEGCACKDDKCYQFQTCSSANQCKGKDNKNEDTAVYCEKGGCACGEGKCPANTVCLGGKCICGRLNESLNWKIPDGGFDSSFAVDPVYGEFACGEAEETGTSGGSYMFYLYCDKPEGCVSNESEPRREKQLILAEGADAFDADYNSEEDVLQGKILDKESIACKDSDKYLERWADLNLSKCGRASAEKFERLFDGHTDLENRCGVRKACDTMPVPRANRASFACDALVALYHLYSSLTVEEYEYLGLRCRGNDCICGRETCAQNALCAKGVCQFDTFYAHETCGNVLPRIMNGAPQYEIHILMDPACEYWAIDEIDSIKYQCTHSDGTRMYLLDASDVADENSTCPSFITEDSDIDLDTDMMLCDILSSNYSIKNAISQLYQPDVRGIYVTDSGTCICGHSIYTPEIDGQYVCIESAGYQCQLKEGCKCGDAVCSEKQYCVRSGQCMDFEKPVQKTDT